MKGILGRKIGMTQVFTKDGVLIPVTVVEVKPNTVMQVKTVESDGYNAIQLGYLEKKENRANKPEMGRCKKANTTPKRFLKEIRDFEGTVNVGDTLSASVFEVGDIIDVTGTSKGKGFTGVIKRNNQSRGPETHGSQYHRRPGSMGTMLPKRVLKGKKLSGHMGVDTVTIQNLEVVEINDAEGYMLVSGNIPGAKNSLVLIRSAVKNSRKKNPKEVISYETVVDEVEEVKTEVEETTTEAEVTTEVENTEAPAEEVVEETAEETQETTEEATEEVVEEENTNEKEEN